MFNSAGYILTFFSGWSCRRLGAADESSPGVQLPTQSWVFLCSDLRLLPTRNITLGTLALAKDVKIMEVASLTKSPRLNGISDWKIPKHRWFFMSSCWRRLWLIDQELLQQYVQKQLRKMVKAKRDPALSQRSIWILSAVLQCTRLAESYLTISCSIHERAIMYKRVSKACECAPCLPGELQWSFFPRGERH